MLIEDQHGIDPTSRDSIPMSPTDLPVSVTLRAILSMTGPIAFLAACVVGIVWIVVYGDGGPLTYIATNILFLLVVMVGVFIFVVRPLMTMMTRIARLLRLEDN